MDYLYALQTARETWGNFLNPILYCVSEFAFYGVPLFILVLYTSVDKKKYFSMAFSMVTANFVVNFIKIVACVYRPWVRDARLHVHPLAEHSSSGYSLPSGHTTGGTTFYGMLALNEYRGKKRVGFIIAMVIMICMTAFSRNWLGAHTILDVISAIIITILCITFCEMLTSYIEKNPEKDILVLIAGLIIVAASIAIFLLKSYPIDYAADGSVLVDTIAAQKDSWLAAGFLAAWLISWYWDRHYIKFTTDIDTKSKIIRGVIAAVIFALLYEVIMKKIAGLMDIRIGSLIRGFVSIFGVAGIYPLIFTKIENRK